MVAYIQESKPRKRYALLATTGCAAQNIGGQTTFNFLKMDINRNTTLSNSNYDTNVVIDTKVRSVL